MHAHHSNKAQKALVETIGGLNIFRLLYLTYYSVPAWLIYFMISYCLKPLMLLLQVDRNYF